jgi:hypothetical protein
MASLHNIVPDMPKMSAPIISPVDWKVKFEESLKAVDMYKALYEKADMRQNQMFELLKVSLKRKEKPVTDSVKFVERFFQLETELQHAEDKRKDMQNYHMNLMRRYHNMMRDREEALKRCQEELEEAKKHVEMFSWPGEFSYETEEMEMETETDEMDTGSETEEMETATDEMETETDEMETETDEMVS